MVSIVKYKILLFNSLYTKCGKIKINGKIKNIYSKKKSNVKYCKYKNEMVRITNKKPKVSHIKLISLGGGFCGPKEVKKPIDDFAQYWYNVKKLNVAYSKGQKGYYFENTINNEDGNCNDANNHNHISKIKVNTFNNTVFIRFTIKIHN